MQLWGSVHRSGTIASYPHVVHACEWDDNLIYNTFLQALYNKNAFSLMLNMMHDFVVEWHYVIDKIKKTRKRVVWKHKVSFKK